jgi:hypothetical protein
MMEFRYRAEGLSGPPPPSLPTGATCRFRPFIPVRIFGPGGRSRFFPHSVLDTGADDTVFPGAAATVIGATLLTTSAHQLRWRGSSYPMRFARIELQLSTRGFACRWPAIVSFSSAPLPYPLLGITGCLEFFDATFRGDDHVVELVVNRSFPGTAKVTP